MCRTILFGFLVPALCVAGESPTRGPTDELEAVVVTASPIGSPEFLATIAGSASRDALLRSGSPNLADALGWVPGVIGSGVAPGASRPVIRGFDANRVRTLEDGVSSFDVSDVGVDHGVPLDPLTAERVEVVRGPATLRYGSQAIGGVVNAITNRVPYRRGAGAAAGEATAGYSDVSDGWNAAGQLNIDAGPFGLHGDAFVRRNGDYDTPLGVLGNSWVENEGGSLGGTWFPRPDSDADRVGLGVVRYGSRYGLPGEDAFIDMDQTRLLLRSAFGFDGSARQLSVDGGWGDYEHGEVEDGGEIGSTFTDRAWELRAELLFEGWRALSESALGAQLQQRDFSALGEGADYLAPTRTRSQALFGFTEAALGQRVRLQLGARVEATEVSGTPIDGVATQRDFTPVSGSAGLVFEGSESWRLGLTLSSAARAPAQTELYARGPHEGPGTFEIGDPSLEEERANSLELSLRWRKGRVHADGSVWVAAFDGFINGAFTGRTCDEEGTCESGDALELRELAWEQRSARFTGAEAHADVDLAQVGGGLLQLNLLGDLVRAEFTRDGSSVPRIPPWRLGVGFTWEAERFDATLRYRYSGRQDRYGEGDTPTPGFANVDAQFAWRPLLSDPGFEVVFAASNLTDSLQRNAVALNKDEVPMPGRDLRLLLRATF
jgi:iron complex outermembrane receptor protein